MFNPLENEALDEWFQRLNAPLKRLPAQERAELHQEVRQHLEALVAANEELGSSPQEAWEHALAQFGDPAHIGRRLAWEWRRGQGWVSQDMAAVLYGLGMQIAWTVALMFAGVILLSSCGLYNDGVAINLLYYALVPTVTGVSIGRKFPLQGLTGAFYSSLALPVLPTALGVEAAALLHHEAPGVLLGLDLQLALLTVCWLGCSCGAAYLASARKRQQWYRPQWADFKLALPADWKKQIVG